MEFGWLRLRHIFQILLRQRLRNSNPAMIVACAVLGAGAGLLTVGLHELVGLLHTLGFALPHGIRLSGGIGVPVSRIVAVPLLGGLLLGILRLGLNRWRHREIVDPIEANAMHGGRMSLLDSLRLTVTTLVSNSAGASVGMEAAYSQLGSGVLSFFGQRLRLRRNDLRIFVGAGAAAAISAAFNAPLAGAFYGFELVMGTYSTATLVQIAVASAAGDMVMRSLVQVTPMFHVHTAQVLSDWDYWAFALLGMIAAPLSIATMRMVGLCETAFKRLPLPVWLRPAVGGALLSVIALRFPQVLGSGYGGIQLQLDHPWPLLAVAGLLLAKVLASSLSIGAGFRGGLFSSSLFMGCLLGDLVAHLLALVVPVAATQQTTFMLVGMGAVGAGIVGAPVTMVLLALEMTGNFPITLAVFVGVAFSTAIVRQAFGFSFSTWRFHLRGLPISGAEDVGWVTELTVGRLMTAVHIPAESSTPLEELRALVPSGTGGAVFLTDGEGRYCGRIETAAIHDREIDDAAPGIVAADLSVGRAQFLLPEQTLRDALEFFALWMVEELPVLASATDRRPIGTLKEPQALRRYSRELESRVGANINSPLFPHIGKAHARHR